MLPWILSKLVATVLPVAIEPSNPVELQSPQALPTFGAHLALSDLHLLVGEPTEDKVGGTYLYDLDVPSQVAQSFVPLIDLNDAAQFGSSFEVSGDLLVIGAPYENSMEKSNIGALYTYTLVGDNWEEQPLAKLVPIPTGNDYFGRSVALDGTTLVVGAPGSDAPPQYEVGRVHAYTWTGTDWAEQTVAAPQPAVNNARQGISVAVSGERLAAFSPGTGEIILYARNADNWVETQRLLPVDFQAQPCGATPEATSDSMWSLYMHGDELLIGIPDHDTDGTAGLAEGAVFVFAFANGKFVCQQRIESSNPQESELFGFALARHDGLMFVGAPGRSARMPLSGAVYGFSKSDQLWASILGPIEKEVQDTSDTFGCALALSGSHLAISGCHPSSPRVVLFELVASLGEGCQLDDECASDVCADGVCCDDAQCVDSQCWRCDGGLSPGQCTIDEGTECDGGAGCDLEAGVCGMAPDPTTGTTSSGGSSDSDGSSTGGEQPTTSSGSPPDPTDPSGGLTTAGGPGPGLGELPELFEGCECRSSGAGAPPWLWCSLLLLARGRSRPRLTTR